MRTWSVGQRLRFGFGLIALLILGGGTVGVYFFATVLQTFSALTAEQLPGMELSARLEQLLLNARIHFIYHVTIQKPGELAVGWEHFHQAQALLPKVLEQIRRSPSLASMVPDAAEMEQSMSAYERELAGVLGLVEQRRMGTPELQQAISRWAGAGGRMVEIAGRLNRKSSALAVDGGNTEAVRTHQGYLFILVTGLAAVLLGSLVAVIVARSN